MKEYWTSENWQNTAPHKRYCRHMLTGRVPSSSAPTTMPGQVRL